MNAGVSRRGATVRQVQGRVRVQWEWCAYCPWCGWEANGRVSRGKAIWDAKRHHCEAMTVPLKIVGGGVQ